MVRKTERNKELDRRLYRCLDFLILAHALPNHKSTHTLPVRHVVGGDSFVYATHTNTSTRASMPFTFISAVNSLSIVDIK